MLVCSYRRSHVLASLKLQMLFSTVDAPTSHGFLKVKALLSLLMPMETYVYERNNDCIGDSSFPVINDQSQFSVTHARSNKAYTNKLENKVSRLEEENERFKKQKVLDASCTCLTSNEIHFKNIRP
ncbi:uncharacterized protein LOC131221782 isoform X2 [Magnolia sinica]|uniref:uncharacterized protein LOC131221782 isoform X2 n=1 Tax=Magnolia sinica TaxID=86752 RepID=UPI002658AB1B|nr:uncharacterized protein LOC131221782 isoform X2 [Magnolia sinica]